jgi:hypothetical protein
MALRVNYRGAHLDIEILPYTEFSANKLQNPTAKLL